MSQIATYSDVALISGVTILGSYNDNKCIKYSDILPNNRSAFGTGDNSIKELNQNTLVDYGINSQDAEDYMSQGAQSNSGTVPEGLSFVPESYLEINGEHMVTLPFGFRKTTDDKTYDVGLISVICKSLVGEYAYADFSYMEFDIMEQPTEATIYLEGMINTAGVILPFSYCHIIPQYPDLSDIMFGPDGTIGPNVDITMMKVQLL